MKCKDCGSEHFELSRLEEIGLNASGLLLEKCERQNDYIKELEKRLEEALRDYEEQKKRVRVLAGFAFKLDEIREVMGEVEFGDFTSIEEKKKEDDQ